MEINITGKPPRRHWKICTSKGKISQPKHSHLQSN